MSSARAGGIKCYVMLCYGRTSPGTVFWHFGHEEKETVEHSVSPVAASLAPVLWDWVLRPSTCSL